MSAFSRRRFLSGAACATVAPTIFSRTARTQPRERPNLVFLLGDDHRWDALGVMGNPFIRTPHIDRLANDGVRFNNMFVTTAICVTSRASIFTGLYAHAHRIFGFSDPLSEDLYSRSYPALLRKAGYRSGFVGKWGIDGGKMPAESFDYFRGFQGQGSYFPEPGHRGRHLTDQMGDQAVEFIESCKPGEPFHLSVSFKAPHVQDEDPAQFLPDPRYEALYRDVEVPTPETADPRHISQLPLSMQRSEARRRWAVRFSTPELYQRSVKNYYRLITGMDYQVQRLRQALERRGLAQNTVILYAGDNGFYLGEHGLAGKWFMHEESIRVPLIIYDPRAPRRRRGLQIEPMALNIDIAPTLLNYAGVEAPPAMQGRTLQPMIAGHRIAWRADWFYAHLFQHNWIPKTEGVRSSDWKYTEYLGEDPRFEELFNMRKDPHETRNLAQDPAYARHLDSMRRRRVEWLDALSKWNPECDWAELEPAPRTL